MNTKLSEAIEIAGLRARYDRSVKVLLANRSILAWILKTCVSEFADYEIETIMDCIEKREISSKAVHKDSADVDGGEVDSDGIDVGEIDSDGIDVGEVDGDGIDVGEIDSDGIEVGEIDSDGEIQGINSEDTGISEQTIYYDIRFTAVVPEKDRKVQLIINIETQMDTSPGYPLEKRVIYYLSRMISSQYGTVFTKSHYEQIEKVYSIWFCPNPPLKKQNTIREIRLGQRSVYGDSETDESATDMMCGMIVNLGDANQDMPNRILRLMNVLLSDTMAAKSKKKILHDEFRIAMTNRMEGDFTKMCNLSQGIWDKAVAQGVAQGIERGMAQGIERGVAQGIEQGVAQGIERGVAQGETRGMDKTTKAMEMIVSRQYTVSEIAVKCEIPEAIVRTICNTLQIRLND